MMMMMLMMPFSAGVGIRIRMHGHHDGGDDVDDAHRAGCPNPAAEKG